MKIKVLSDNLINQIAAGEVVERPANVIKELVENSLDALASEINIFIKGFGLSFIQVSDNGIGMDYDDLNKSIMRHATSKIFTENDLENIKTLGFRGEAIPSIASISNMEIYSKTANGDGHFLKISAGKVIDKGFYPCKDGCDVIVKDLFFNTPARYKYLKSEQTEKKIIIDYVRQFSLANPTIKFCLKIDDKIILQTFGQAQPNDLIAAVYGETFSKNLLVVDNSTANIKVKIIAISPDYVRSNKNDINVFVNGRFVQNYILKEAVVDAFQGYIMQDRYPMVCIYLKLDPYLIDVNVHPQKLTIKLINEYALKSLITQMLKEKLSKEYRKFSENESYKTIFNNFDTSSTLLDTTFSTTYLSENNHCENPITFFEEKSLIIKDDNKIPFMEYIGTFHKTFLLFQNAEGLFLLDQHAAAERINYEIFLKKPISINTLSEYLFPYKPNLKDEEIKIMIKNKAFFNRHGFLINNLGEVLKYPTELENVMLDDVLEYLINCILNMEEVDYQKFLIDKIKMNACKKSIKANHLLSFAEISELVKRLSLCDNPYHCPHGRPTIIKLTKQEIEKLFKRVL